MRTATSLLTLFTMALHSALGCCWHHAHAAAPQTVSPSGKDGDCRDHGCRYHWPKADESLLGDGPKEGGPGERCPGECEGSCKYLAGPKTQISDGDGIPAWGQLVVASGLKSGATAAHDGATFWNSFLPAVLAAPTAAALQIWRL